jgi:hypothetical protein
MSHEAVKGFYKMLSESPTKAESYVSLTHGFFGYRLGRIVTFAKGEGFEFTKSELAFIRLTNRKERGHGPMTRKMQSIDDYCDYAPTAHPVKPHAEDEFYEKHNRYVDGAEGPLVSVEFPAHALQNGVCTQCGCSKVYIDAHHPKCSMTQEGSAPK